MGPSKTTVRKAWASIITIILSLSKLLLGLHWCVGCRDVSYFQLIQVFSQKLFQEYSTHYWSPWQLTLLAEFQQQLFLLCEHIFVLPLRLHNIFYQLYFCVVDFFLRKALPFFREFFQRKSCMFRPGQLSYRNNFSAKQLHSLTTLCAGMREGVYL